MAQLGRALRSGRRGRRFKSCRLDWHIRSVGQAVKTPPSHGGNRGSIPLRTTLRKNDGSCSFLVFSSGIEVVITGLTRNQFAGNRTGVRIPPAAQKKRQNSSFASFFCIFNSGFLASSLFNLTNRKKCKNRRSFLHLRKTAWLSHFRHLMQEQSAKNARTDGEKHCLCHR